MKLFTKNYIVKEMIEMGVLKDSLEMYRLEQSGDIVLPTPNNYKAHRNRDNEPLYTEEQSLDIIRLVKDYKTNAVKV